MGIIDIFYNELNRIRDKKQSEEKKKDEIYRLLKKLLRRFIIDWEQFITANDVNFYEKTERFYEKYRENLLDILVEIEEFLTEDIATQLREICRILEEGKNTIPALGKEAYEERKKYGDKAKEICENVLKKIDQQLL